jgi:HAD superfamily hydrolase (TIGR01509 family)
VTVSLRPLRAVLWDMDGLLVDTEPVWTLAEEELAAELGGTWSPQLKATIAGTRLDVAVPAILEHYGRPTTAADVAWASGWLLRRMGELFASEPTVLPGVRALLTELAARQVPVALVSSSYRALVQAVLAHGLGPFDVTVAGDEVGHGKPHPEPYLTAAARLGVDPQDCVVLEDSVAGVLAGEAAGCAVLAVPSVPGVTVLPGPRTLVRASLAGVTMADLQALL